MHLLLEYIMKSKGLKIGGGLIGGSGIVAVFLNFVNGKDVAMKEYVNLKNDTVIEKVENLKHGQDLILKTLNKIDDRLYKLKTKGGK